MRKPKPKAPAEATVFRIERDLDGYVHTALGFMSEGAYRDAQRRDTLLLPRYEDIPLMKFSTSK
jgi:hypothetical protein